jgi:ribonuclease P protein component
MKRGEVWRGKHMKITYLAATPTSEKWKMENGKLFVGTIASTKTEKSAVKRNRMRRRCREALRITVKEVTKNQKRATRNFRVQLLISPRSSSLTCDFRELLKDMELFLTVLTQHAA